jgi:hypothetical protein
VIYINSQTAWRDRERRRRGETKRCMKTGKQKAKKKERERKREKIKIHHERETLERKITKATSTSQKHLQRSKKQIPTFHE